jgi:hypothetical protein
MQIGQFQHDGISFATQRNDLLTHRASAFIAFELLFIDLLAQ